jgi:hypothetical protein
MISWGIQLYKSWGICGHPGVNPHRSSGATLRSTKPWFLKGSTNFDSNLNHFGIFWGPQNWLGNWRFVNLGVELDISKKDLPTSPSPTAFQRTWCYHHWNKKVVSGHQLASQDRLKPPTVGPSPNPHPKTKPMSCGVASPIGSVSLVLFCGFPRLSGP